jgi:hypothetical protein
VHKSGAKVASSREFGECGYGLGGALNPSFKTFPVFGWDGDDSTFEQGGFSRGTILSLRLATQVSRH